MENSWHVVKWICIAVLVVYFVVQMLAIRRLRGEPRNRSVRVLCVILVFTMLQSWIEEVFENREASRISMFVVGVVAAFATAFLARMLQARKEGVAGGGESGGEGQIQSLKLG